MQDLSYIHHKRAVDQKKIEKLRSTLHFINDEDEKISGEKRKRNHIVFVDSDKEAKSLISAKDDDDDDDEDDSINIQRSPKKSATSSSSSSSSARTSILSAELHESASKAAAAEEGPKLPTAVRKKIEAKSANTYQELKARENRSDKLLRTVDYLQQQKVCVY
jgi:hypothetical protein